MANKFFRPMTPGRRSYSVASFEELTTSKPEKSLLAPLKSKSGRNNSGRITVRRRGGGHKRAYRIIDFKGTDKLGIEATVKTIEYDPNRSAYIALICYTCGEKRYILSPKGLSVGDKVICDEKAPLTPGNRMKIKNVPLSYNIYNLELFPGKGGQIIKAAGSFAKLISLDGDNAQVELPSGEIRYFSKEVYVSVGELSNADHSLIRIGKAGRVRWMGRRPKVLGKSMNAVDHPHGGGEGHSPIGLIQPKTPWGMPALGYKTRKRNKWTNKWIAVSRHRNKSK